MPYSDELKEKYIKQLNPRETCALKIAQESLDSGQAKEKLELLKKITNENNT